jgi:hypothetical protein
MINKIEAVIKSLSTRNAFEPDDLLSNSTRPLKKN